MSQNLITSSNNPWSIQGYFDKVSKSIYLKDKIRKLENEINNHKEELLKL